MKDKLLRKLIPSMPVLARTPIAPLLDIGDGFIKRKHPEWAHLPPASLRMRIGVGNTILRNHQSFIDAGKSIVDELSVRQYLRPDSAILELGCGCGRNAIALSQYLEGRGTYIGQDVDEDMIHWCQQHLQNGKFHFHHANIFSAVYNPKGKPADDYEFPAHDATISLIVSVSLFSHLLFKDFNRYIAQSKRVLANSGYLHMTLFLMDFVKTKTGDRWTFSHALDNCYVENLRYPEAAVAYDISVVRRILSEHGLSIVEIYNQNVYQQTLIAQKTE